MNNRAVSRNNRRTPEQRPIKSKKAKRSSLNRVSIVRDGDEPTQPHIQFLEEIYYKTDD